MTTLGRSPMTSLCNRFASSGASSPADAAIEDVEDVALVPLAQGALETLRVRHDVTFAGGRGRTYGHDLDRGGAGQAL
ncbi:hypothetical protein [Bradyrhizobium sp. USDA 3364]